MKPNFTRWINSSIKIATLVVAFAILASCEDKLATDNRPQDVPLVDAKSPDQVPSPSLFSTSASCSDDLANDGCNFTSGSGRDYPNQFLMVAMMSNCRTEGLPAGCSWDGNITQTKIIEVDLSNCCYPFSSFNFTLNSWKALAVSNRPASDYLITNYQRINGYMVTTYGPYRMVIQVTYKKKACSRIIGSPQDPIAYPD